MSRGNDTYLVAFRFDESKSVVLHGDKIDRPHWRVVLSRDDTMSFEPQQEGCSRFSNDVEVKTRLSHIQKGSRHMETGVIA